MAYPDLDVERFMQHVYSYSFVAMIVCMCEFSHAVVSFDLTANISLTCLRNSYVGECVFSVITLRTCASTSLCDILWSICRGCLGQLHEGEWKTRYVLGLLTSDVLHQYGGVQIIVWVGQSGILTKMWAVLFLAETLIMVLNLIICASVFLFFWNTFTDITKMNGQNVLTAFQPRMSPKNDSSFVQ